MLSVTAVARTTPMASFSSTLIPAIPFSFPCCIPSPLVSYHTVSPILPSTTRTVTSFEVTGNSTGAIFPAPCPSARPPKLLVYLLFSILSLASRVIAILVLAELMARDGNENLTAVMLDAGNGQLETEVPLQATQVIGVGLVQ